MKKKKKDMKTPIRHSANSTPETDAQIDGRIRIKTDSEIPRIVSTISGLMLFSNASVIFYVS